MIRLSLDVLKKIRVRMGDRLMRRTKENVCCEHVKKVDYVSWPFLGIVHLNVNYCFVCGRKLKR